MSSSESEDDGEWCPMRGCGDCCRSTLNPASAYYAGASNRTHCRACDEELPEKPLRCARCKRDRYCDRKCQRIDWPEHKKWCVPQNPRYRSPEFVDGASCGPRWLFQKDEEVLARAAPTGSMMFTGFGGFGGQDFPACVNRQSANLMGPCVTDLAQAKDGGDALGRYQCGFCLDREPTAGLFRQCPFCLEVYCGHECENQRKHPDTCGNRSGKTGNQEEKKAGRDIRLIFKRGEKPPPRYPAAEVLPERHFGNFEETVTLKSDTGLEWAHQIAGCRLGISSGSLCFAIPQKIMSLREAWAAFLGLANDPKPDFPIPLHALSNLVDVLDLVHAFLPPLTEGTEGERDASQYCFNFVRLPYSPGKKGCTKTGKLICKKCNVAVYCSKKCEKRHRAAHEVDCSQWSENCHQPLAPGTQPDIWLNGWEKGRKITIGMAGLDDGDVVELYHRADCSW